MQRAGLDFELEGGPDDGGHGAFLTQMEGLGGYAGLDNFGVTQTDQVCTGYTLRANSLITCNASCDFLPPRPPLSSFLETSTM
jgi:hypothetical protein